MNIAICTIAIGQWYPKGAARMMEAFLNITPGYFVKVWTDAYPPGTPDNMVENQFNYRPYAAKPFALLEAMSSGADVAILLDASFYPIRSIEPLVEHIVRTGYFLCRNGFSIGEWTSDHCLAAFLLNRDQAMLMPDCSSYCVGIDCRGAWARRLVEEWGRRSTRETICGAHTNFMYKSRRSWNAGFVSNERRCRGHRHDQSVLSLVAHELGMLDFVSRPKFTTYKGHETEETVLVCEGMM